jgi:hypothetical protein
MSASALTCPLYEQAVLLPAVQAALLLDAARRTLRNSHLMPLAPIRTLHYFLPIFEEVLPSRPSRDISNTSAESSSPSRGKNARSLASANTPRTGPQYGNESKRRDTEH